MTVSATYMPDLSRVRIAMSGLDTAADYALVERSVDGITWVTVRGGEQVTLSAGSGVLDDYEFVPGVVNTYRVTAVDATAQQWIDTAGPVSGNNAGLSPASPGPTLVGDTLVMLASIRGTSATVTQPSGWITIVDLGNVKVFARYAAVAGSQVYPVAFSGGAAGDDTIAQIALFRNTSISPSGTPATLSNASQQNLPWPAASPLAAGTIGIVVGWKQDDWTPPAVPSDAWDSGLGDTAVTAGNDAGQVWWRRTKTTAATQPAGSWTITGGAAAVSKSAMFFLPPKPFTNQESTTITPTIDKVWLKNPARPFMNTALDVPVGLLDIEREARAGVFPVVGRSLPVAVTDQRLGKEYTIGAQVASDAERDRLDAILSAGDVVFLQIPPGDIRLKSMFAVIGRSNYDDESGVQWMPLSQCAAPPVSVAGATSTWQTVISTYATCADLIAAKPTCADVLDIVGDPSDIITG
jgi:hypothetical protein